MQLFTGSIIFMPKIIHEHKCFTCCSVGWLGQNNDYQFIQELRANRCSGWIRGRTHSLLQGKSALPCSLQRLKVVQQAMSNSRDQDPFDGITESDVEDAAPDSLIIDASDTEVIDIEYGR